ncbi:hypothetical protein H103_02306 [Trichophyton rubrum CBS 288.86]|uniref:Uncharacterized protein n=1 Tax=Trichophyton rubrum CBS 288.86 TaxID=1215330 RepID=A0A022WAB5_TRIRU|nr:hypothetical protein H100_02297 [Trichophyton rubrum MR850]EZF55061.1 hypothetical protein H103_02306 [Trichophyton rubrum CBS 288.86]EZF86991.1 hypothetical protein H110_02301 [Trichophyton rubrum MR1448]
MDWTLRCCSDGPCSSGVDPKCNVRRRMERPEIHSGSMMTDKIQRSKPEQRTLAQHSLSGEPPSGAGHEIIIDRTCRDSDELFLWWRKSWSSVLVSSVAVALRLLPAIQASAVQFQRRPGGELPVLLKKKPSPNATIEAEHV